MSKRRKNPSPSANQPPQQVKKTVQKIPTKRLATEMNLNIDKKLIELSEEELQLINQLQDLRKSKIMMFIAGDGVQMRDDIALNAFHLLQELGKNERIDMLLHSRGGQTEVPGKLVPLIRNYCDHFGVIIPYRAHSAATHMALGANEIVMGPMSELGPVDPSRTHPLLPKDKDGNPIPISVQDLKHVVDLLVCKTTAYGSG